MRDLHIEFRTGDGVAKVINGVSYHLDPGETLAVLGESGSGKSVTAQAIMGILDTPPGTDPLRRDPLPGPGPAATAARSSAGRSAGKEIAMIFQDALSALNPVFPVGWQIGETLRQRSGHVQGATPVRRAVELMDLVQIPGAAKPAQATTRTSSPAACGSA